jgi:hypothetical protein
MAKGLPKRLNFDRHLDMILLNLFRIAPKHLKNFAILAVKIRMCFYTYLLLQAYYLLFYLANRQ